MTQFLTKLLQAASIAFIFCFLCACTTTTPLELEDKGAQQASLSLEKSLGESKRFRLFVQANQTSGSARYAESNVVDPIIVGGRELTGDVTLDADYDFQTLNAGFLYRLLNSEYAELSLGLGLGYANYDIDIRHATEGTFAVDNSSSGLGVYMQLGIPIRDRWRFNYDVGSMTNISSDLSSIVNHKASVAYRFHSKLELSAGYFIQLYSEENFDVFSDVELNSSGLQLGLTWHFDE